MALLLEKLVLHDFRCYRKASFGWEARTVIVGPNASGKTNLLEAAFLFASGKSFRAGREAEMVRWGEPAARVEAAFKGERTNHRAAVTLDASARVIKKSLELDGKVRPTRELRRRFPMVLFSADDIRLVDGSPGRRRRTLDLAVGQGSVAYQQALSSYNRALASRNRLLEQIAAREATEAELDAWDAPLAEAGAAVIEGRTRFFADSADRLTAAYAALTAASGDVHGRLAVAHEPGAPDFAAALSARRTQDIAVGTTTTGPHRDDWTLLLDGRGLASFGSGGEFRSAALAWRLAEAAWLAQRTEVQPILLLDDVFSELDAARSESLRAALPDGQTVITTPEAAAVPESLRREAKVITIDPEASCV